MLTTPTSPQSTPTGSESKSQPVPESKVLAAIQDEYQRVVAAALNTIPCPYCQGCGGVTLDVPYGHQYFGRAFPCPCGAGKTAHHMEADKLRKLFSETGVPELVRTSSFDMWHEWVRRDGWDAKRTALDFCWMLAHEGSVRNSKGFVKYGVVLSGDVGTGKSSMAAAIANTLHDAGRQVLWQDFNKLIATVQDTYNSQSKTSKMQVINAASGVDVLILDDVGGKKDTLTPHTISVLYDVIRPRWEKHRTTILTTNLTAEEYMAQVDLRVYRRTRELCCWVRVLGQNISEKGY